MTFSRRVSQPPSTSGVDFNDVHADLSANNRDSYKFSHGLTGVDQRSNYVYVNILTATICILTLLTIAFRIWVIVLRDRRHTAVVGYPKNQAYWTRSRSFLWSWIKSHAIYAPIWKHRHNREINLFRDAGFGTLPTRIQFVLLVVYTTCNIGYCLVIPWKEIPNDQAVAELRGRCGALAVFNLIFTILFALRNNPFIWILGISYDTFNLFHRWMARIVFLESLAHITAWMYNTHRTGGDQGISWVLGQASSYRWGLTAFISFSVLVIHSLGPLRHAFYETFLSIHQLCIAVAMSGVYYHMAKHALLQLPWFYLLISLLAAEPLLRTWRIIYANSSWNRRTWTKVTIEALSGKEVQASRVTFALPRSWNASPGSHVHVYLPRLGLWSSHPFSVAWSTRDPVPARFSTEVMQARTPDPEKLPTKISLCDMDALDQPLDRPRINSNSISLLVRARSGLTKSLYSRALASPARSVELWGAIEGPYGVCHSLDSYGTGYTEGVTATQKVLLYWSVPSLECLKWVKEWMGELEQMEGWGDVARVRVFVSMRGRAGLAADNPPTIEGTGGESTTSTSTEDQRSCKTCRSLSSICGTPGPSGNIGVLCRSCSSDTLVSQNHEQEADPDEIDEIRPLPKPQQDQHQHQQAPQTQKNQNLAISRLTPSGIEIVRERCDPKAVIQHMASREEQIGAMAVSVCGPGAYSDAVRAAVRSVLVRGGSVIDFFEEAFSY